MTRRIIEFSANNRVFVLLGVLALVVVAVFTLEQIRLDALPDLSDTQVIVFSRWDRSPVAESRRETEDPRRAIGWYRPAAG